MNLKKDFDTLLRDAQKSLNVEIDGAKLSLVEGLSLFFTDVFSGLLVAAFSLLALLAILAAAVVAAASVVGYVFSLLIVASLLLVAALLLHLLRSRLFANMLVARFCRMFFKDKECGDETD
ncbi:MAG: hypothetical protein IJZ22_04310 [Bacteroidaceae bacterium]|nr:hypothetical protein [Bacteroidaceae bacterium]